MFRKNREVKEQDKIDGIINTCDCCRIAMADDEGAYIVPLNFGYENREGQRYFYFHCAQKGKKTELLKEQPNVGFEMDCNHGLRGKEEACTFTFLYQSIIGKGCISFLEDTADKIHGLQCIMEHYTGRRVWQFTESSLKQVTVLCMEVTEITGKEQQSWE